MEKVFVICDKPKYMTNIQNESNSSWGSKRGNGRKGMKYQRRMPHIKCHKEEMPLQDIKLNPLKHQRLTR